MKTADMLIELRRLCPGFWGRPLREFDPSYSEGIWTGQDTPNIMPDGEAMFSDLANGCPGYSGPIHTGFEAWLNARDWWVENHDGATFFLLPDEWISV